MCVQLMNTCELVLADNDNIRDYGVHMGLGPQQWTPPTPSEGVDEASGLAEEEGEGDEEEEVYWREDDADRVLSGTDPQEGEGQGTEVEGDGGQGTELEGGTDAQVDGDGDQGTEAQVGDGTEEQAEVDGVKVQREGQHK